MSRYRVTAPYVTCRSVEAARMVAALAPQLRPQELATGGFSRGAILPASVPQEDIGNLLAAGLIETVAE